MFSIPYVAHQSSSSLPPLSSLSWGGDGGGGGEGSHDPLGYAPQSSFIISITRSSCKKKKIHVVSITIKGKKTETDDVWFKSQVFLRKLNIHF